MPHTRDHEAHDEERGYPSIADLAAALSEVQDSIDEDSDEDSDHYIDVRLQVHAAGSWSLHTGDSSYDQDHRGWWGSSSLSVLSDCSEVAAELISEAQDQEAQSS